MELRHLRYFVAVAEKLSFRAAADDLHLSHPALSRQIKDLEYELGVRLLERNTISVWLTVAGSRLLTDAKDILSRVDQAIYAVKNEAGENTSLVLSTPGPFWDSVLQDVLKRFRQTHPHVDIRIVDKAPWHQVAAMNHGEFQLGFVGDHDIGPSKTIEHELVQQSTFGIVLGEDHPLANHKSLTWEDIKNEQIYILGTSRASHHLQDIRSLLPDIKLAREQTKRTSSMDSLITLLSTCQGITFMPRSFANGRKGSLRYIPLSDARTEGQFKMWAIWRKDDHSQPLKDLVDLIRNYADGSKKA